MNLIRNLKIRWKLLAVVLPLVVLPIVVVGGMVGYIANGQATLSITRTSKDDLEHMADFTIDLLNANYQQFQVYKEDKKRTIHQDLATLVRFAVGLVESQHRQYGAGNLTLETARAEARKALKQVNVGETGYIYAITTGGELVAHVAKEGENIYDAVDDSGRPFIREMIDAVYRADPGEVLYTVYPWRNEILGDKFPRKKVVAYQYFEAWDWIVAAGSYLDETYEDEEFERRSFDELKSRIQAKQVGQTGYIYAMTTDGVLTLHPYHEGRRIYDEQDDLGRYFIREMCDRKQGWIRYPWRNEGEPSARMKVVRYDYFAPWGWIVAVGSYEDEFYREANELKRRIAWGVGLLTLVVGLVSLGFVFGVSELLVRPIRQMIGVVRQVRGGDLDAQMRVNSTDELGELADGFNQMTASLRENREMESSLAQQEKMASLGVLASRVAHEINNPIGVILGYAAHLEGNFDRQDPSFRFVQEIRQESQRCKGIVQDLLNYVRVPRPKLVDTDVNRLLDQLLAFAINHSDLHGVQVTRDYDPALSPIPLDPDQFRQVALNLVINAGAAAGAGGRVTLRTQVGETDTVEVHVVDNGPGISADDREKIFEPFFTTRDEGTGLGLAISRQIVERHGGRIRITSELGVGTTVIVTLPAERPAYP